MSKQPEGTRSTDSGSRRTGSKAATESRKAEKFVMEYILELAESMPTVKVHKTYLGECLALASQGKVRLLNGGQLDGECVSVRGLVWC